MITRYSKTCRRSAAFFAALALLCFLLSACAVRTRPTASAVYLWSEENYEIGYDIEFRQNASGSTFAIVHFVYCRELTSNKYYVNQRAVFNRLADLLSPSAPGRASRPSPTLTDGEHSYPLTRYFYDQDSRSCCGFFMIGGALDESRARFKAQMKERSTVQAGEVTLEYVFYDADKDDLLGTIVIRTADIVALTEDGYTERAVLDYAAENGCAILTERGTGARFRLLLELGSERVPVKPEWVRPSYAKNADILSAVDFRIPKTALPGSDMPVLILEEQK